MKHDFDLKALIVTLWRVGAITDMDATINTIVRASSLPLSILIIGVGNADFGSMTQLDGDDARLTNASGQRVERDIVQFVRLVVVKWTDGWIDGPCVFVVTK